MDLEKILRYGLTGVATMSTAILGEWDLALQILFIVMLLDIATGAINGIQEHNFSSKRMRKGIGTKAIYLIIIILCYQIDIFIGNSTPIFRTGACYLYVFVECSSILENAIKAGVPVPKKLVDILAVIKHKSGGSATEEAFKQLDRNKEEDK